MVKRAAVVGLGTVGIPLALMVAEAGVLVVGLERDARKVDALNRGEYPLPGKEPGITELLQSVRKTGRFEATTDPDKMRGADVFLVCVETPFDHARNEPNYAALRGAVETLATRIAKGALVVVESDDGSGDPEAQRAGLTAHPAAVQGGDDVEALLGVGEAERLGHEHLQHRAREVVLERTPVEQEPAGAGGQPHARDRLLTASRRANHLGRTDHPRTTSGVT
jgi:ketopantoate reductase